MDQSEEKILLGDSNFTDQENLIMHGFLDIVRIRQLDKYITDEEGTYKVIAVLDRVNGRYYCTIMKVFKQRTAPPLPQLTRS